MAFRTWVKLLSATLGVAALAGASQLGLAYGLGILRLTRVLDVTTRDQWTAQLAWVAWYAMAAAVVGALVGSWLLPRWAPGFLAKSPAPPETGDPSVARPLDPPVPSNGTIIAFAFAAAIGAAVVVPLTMQPARTAQIAGVNAVLVIGICAGLGAVVGIFAAWAAIAQVISRWSLVTIGLAVWAIALISVSTSLAPSDPLPAVRLGVFDAGFLSPATTQRTALFTMPALALLAGAALGWRARRQERPTLTIALAGLPGPALLTLAYLIAGPGAGDDRYQVVPYWAAMTATGAGVLGSVLAAVLRRGPGPEDGDDDEPTEGRPPLPRRDNQKDSAIAKAGAAPTPPGDDVRPADTGVFDAPSGQVRPAPSGGRGPVAAPWSPAAGAPPGPLGSPTPPPAPDRGESPGAAFTERPGEWPKRHPNPTASHGLPTAATAVPATSATAAGARPAGVTLGEYAEPEPPAFDGFARGKQPRAATSPAQHAAPEQAADRIPAPRKSRPGPPPKSRPAPVPKDVAPPATAKPYVPEPATRPLLPEVLGHPDPLPESPPLPRGGAFGRGLRSLGRSRAADSTVDLPLPANADRAPAHSADAETEAKPAPTGRKRGRRQPLVPEPQAISAPLPQPTPITPALPQPKPMQRSQPPRPSEPLLPPRPSEPLPTPSEPVAPARHSAPLIPADEHQEPEAKSGRRFGLKKRKDNNDYVDWVSGLGDD